MTSTLLNDQEGVNAIYPCGRKWARRNSCSCCVCARRGIRFLTDSKQTYWLPSKPAHLQNSYILQLKRIADVYTVKRNKKPSLFSTDMVIQCIDCWQACGSFADISTEVNGCKCS